GDADDFQLLHGTAVVIGAQASERPPPVRNHRPSDAAPMLLVPGIRDYRNRAVSYSSVDVAIPVGALPAHGDERKARLNAPRVVVQATDLRIAAAQRSAGAPQQFREVHCLHYRQRLDIPMAAITRCRHGISPIKRNSARAIARAPPDVSLV